MRNIAVLLIAILVFSLVGPYTLSAEQGKEVDTSTTNVENAGSDSPEDTEGDGSGGESKLAEGTKGDKSGGESKPVEGTEGEESDGESKLAEGTEGEESDGESKPVEGTEGEESDGESKSAEDTEGTNNNADSNSGSENGTDSNSKNGTTGIDTDGTSSSEEDTTAEDDESTSKDESTKEIMPFGQLNEPFSEENDKIDSSKKVKVQSISTSNTSRLGHVRSTAKIYSDFRNQSSYKSVKGYMNAVYYIKKQADINGERFYLISTQPSSTKGVVGWVKAKQMVTHSHTGVDNKAKTLYVKGNGSAYNKAWGGSKDLVYKNLSPYKYHAFKVNLTEKVGNNVWYQGTLNGKTAWVHSSYVTDSVDITVKNTSRLGHVRGTAKIYADYRNQSSYKSVKGYTNAVYYIKKQADINGERFYLISTQPSSTKGVVGWVKAKELVTHSHTGVDKKAKTLYIKGNGSAYSKAWGGSKDLVYKNLSPYKYHAFKVNLTEKVGNNVWYRGTLNGKTAWVHSSYVTDSVDITVNNTSRLGHVRGTAKIYADYRNQSSYKSVKGYTNAVYYIKKQAEINGERFYLISTQPSSTKGVIGWVKAKDMVTYAHTSVDKKSKTFYVKGTGKAYSKAWGGSKDLVYNNLSNHKYRTFKVNLTEKVGNNVWYRGTINGKTAWLHSSYVVTSKKVSNTSRLGHIRSTAKIYPNLHNPSSYKTSKGYTNAVYYIKKQTQINGEIFYLISTQPSSTKGVVGWVNAKQMVTYSHTGVDSHSKTYYVKGSGSAYSKAWGGSKDLVYKSLSSLQGEAFRVNLTEKVGNNVWYRGKLKGKTAWIHESYLNGTYVLNKRYDLSLKQALEIQKTANPQTTNNYDTYVSKEYINSKNVVTADVLNVRGGPSTNNWIVGQLKKGKKVTILGEKSGWYQIEFTKDHQFVNASPNDILYYLNPNNFKNDKKQQFQFLDLARTSGASKAVLNNYLRGKGTLAGKGQAFIDAGRQNGINDVYLISHAILETGHGTSALAKGVKYNGKTVYNMYGIGAYDGCPIKCGAQRAYEEGWTTPYKAIVGGGKFIGNGYIKSGLNTLYKMRWNPAAMQITDKYGKQYATDVGWASKQVHSMYNLYQEIGSYAMNLDIPVYKPY